MAPPAPTTAAQAEALRRRGRFLIRLTLRYWPEIRDRAPYILGDHVAYLAHRRAELAWNDMAQELRGTDAGDAAARALGRLWGLYLLDLDPVSEWWEGGRRMIAKTGGRLRSSREQWAEALTLWRTVRPTFASQFPPVAPPPERLMRFLPSIERAAWHKYREVMG